MIIFFSAEVKPSVIVSFKNESDAAVIGHTLEWECEAEGSPLPKITWLKVKNIVQFSFLLI